MQSSKSVADNLKILLTIVQMEKIKVSSAFFYLFHLLNYYQITHNLTE